MSERPSVYFQVQPSDMLSILNLVENSYSEATYGYAFAVGRLSGSKDFTKAQKLSVLNLAESTNLLTNS